MIRRIALLLLILVCAGCVSAQIATSVRVQHASPDDRLGTAIATAAGQDVTVSGYAYDAWLINNGRAVVYSSTDGAGGFENEGQSLWLYDLSTNTRRKLMTEIYVIEKVYPTTTRSGKTALLVTMSDGGLGAPHVAVIDPARGEVWRQRISRFVGVRNGRIAVASYRPEDIGDINPKPRRITYLDLDTLLRRQANPYWPIGMAPGYPQITGQVTYRERIALPRDAEVVVQLVSPSRPGERETLLAEQRIPTNGRQVPIPFALRYDPARISSEELYEIRASILVDGRTRFASREPMPVLTRGNPHRDIEVSVTASEDSAG